MQVWFNTHNRMNMIDHINKRKNKNHMILSIDAEKAFDKIQDPFLFTTLQSVRLEGTFLNILKAIYKKAHSKYHSQWGSTGSLSPQIRNKTGMSTLTTAVQHSTGSPSLSLSLIHI